MKSLTIALDYDMTFTADPVLWSEFARNARKAGHKVLIVTARLNTPENTDDINAQLDHYQCQMPIIMTSLASKINYCEAAGIHVDIWIDDDPVSLVRGH